MAASIMALFSGLFSAASAILFVPVAAFALGYLLKAIMSWRNDWHARGRVLNNI